MGAGPSRPNRSDVEDDELLSRMMESPDVVKRYYEANRDAIEKYITENFFAEDVEEWLKKIRERPPKVMLEARKVDYLKEANSKTNNTSLYENSSLVIRRAWTFDLDVHLSRAYNGAKDAVTLILSIGSKPNEASRTLITCPVGPGPEPGSKATWSSHVLQSEGKDPKVLSLRVNVPVNAIVARYKLSIEMTSDSAEGRKTSTFDAGDFITLFNPFTPDDTVYMEDEAMRKEYVLSDDGILYNGSYYSIGQKVWDYSQFDEGVLDNVLLLLLNDSRHLNQPDKSWKKRHDPVYVSRVLTAMVNCNDDKGIIWGRWDGKYDDGKSPGSWFDSAKILKEWRDNGMKPVKYGQCWVFAAVLNTALRAIGIPARAITNFASAHDTNANVTVDMYFDMDTGDRLNASSDSVWNFHVWNEGYFRRPDLEEGYDGWQVLDATPQEVSEVFDPKYKGTKLFQCGPAPVKAIKEGNINVGVDGNFIFGEVNADRVHWMVKDRKITGQPRVLKRSVGKNMSTKGVGTWSREDVTDTYKYKEGTEEERIAFRKAYGRGTMDHNVGFENASVLIKPKFEIEIQPGDVAMGSDLSKTLKIKNISESKCNTDIKVVGSSKRHIGLIHAVIKRFKTNVDIEPGKVEEMKFEISHTEYMKNIVDNNIINVRVVATDTSDGNTILEELDVSLTPPQCISVTPPASVRRNEDTPFDIVFTNLFSFPLTNGVFDVSFRGNRYGDREITVGKSIAPGEVFTVKDILLSPRWYWRIKVTITFTSSEVKDMQHSFQVPVTF